VTIVAVIAVSGIAAGSSSSPGSTSSTKTAQAQDYGRITLPVSPGSAPRCRSAHRAIRFYARRIAEHRETLGTADPRGLPTTRATGCPRYLAHVLQRKAHELRLEVERWIAYQYDWASWLPDKWQRIGACETGYGRRPGNWRHSNSAYEGAFGFARQSWDSFKWRADPKAGPYPEDAWQATPRQQYEVALAIWRAYGFSGWGCRGA